MDAHDLGETVALCMASGQETFVRRIAAETTGRELESGPGDQRPSEWVLLARVGPHRILAHSPDRRPLERKLAQRRYEYSELFRLDPQARLDPRRVESPPSPRNVSVEHLSPYDVDILTLLTWAGCLPPSAADLTVYSFDWVMTRVLRSAKAA